MGLALRLELAYRGLTLRLELAYRGLALRLVLTNRCLALPLELAYRGLALRLELAYRGLWWVLGDIQCEHFTQIGDGGGGHNRLFLFIISKLFKPEFFSKQNPSLFPIQTSNHSNTPTAYHQD